MENTKALQESKSKESRRTFLLAVGAGSVATVAAIATPSVTREGTTVPKVQERNSGYQLSEHVRNYYRTTLV